LDAAQIDVAGHVSVVLVQQIHYIAFFEAIIFSELRDAHYCPEEVSSRYGAVVQVILAFEKGTEVRYAFLAYDFSDVRFYLLCLVEPSRLLARTCLTLLLWFLTL